MLRLRRFRRTGPHFTGKRYGILSALPTYDLAYADDASGIPVLSALDAYLLGLRAPRPPRDRGARAHARHPLLRRRHRDPAGAHARGALAEVEASARDEIIAAKAAIDRAYALLLSEPQILVAWAAAADEPEIIGDPTLVTSADAPQRVLAFGTWLEPDKAQRHGARGRCAARPRRKLRA